eukprot:CAMPEP_0194055176 /NCGR_PEP_ID=MMETSP0009_2-20130614/55849_1 /TAXON_ID=210454 /ORGANISM="Grammatophora oceanica, Strain CCMP 410" /LENGTH=68 /DNA_ID=CAMNT_0038703987 /DNA_START=61 /DNA_END=263 /DNA_ORIENTATION=+
MGNEASLPDGTMDQDGLAPPSVGEDPQLEQHTASSVGRAATASKALRSVFQRDSSNNTSSQTTNGGIP